MIFPLAATVGTEGKGLPRQEGLGKDSAAGRRLCLQPLPAAGVPTPWGARQGNGDPGRASVEVLVGTGGRERVWMGVPGKEELPLSPGAPWLPEPTCLWPWELCPGTSMPAAGLRLGLCRNLATSPRVPRQTLRSPRERVVVFDSCCVTFLEGSSLLFPAEPARSSGGESQCERWRRQASEHSPAETPLSDGRTLLLTGPVPAAPGGPAVSPPQPAGTVPPGVSIIPAPMG